MNISSNLLLTSSGIDTEGKALIVGSSAGGVVLGPDLRIVAAFDPDLATGYGNLSGVGLLPFTILPHINRWQERLPDLAERLNAFTIETGLRVETIRDGYARLLGADREPR